MKVHNWHTLGWIIWAACTLIFFFIWEWIGLASREDDRQPLTFFIRKFVGDINNPLWWLLLGMLIWMIVHFLFIHNS